MLYDPKWEKPAVKADPFSLENLIAWLETMPADGEYRWQIPSSCLIGQWVQSTGITNDDDVSMKSCRLTSGGSIFALIAYGGEGALPALTFGAALSRARALLSDNQANG